MPSLRQLQYLVALDEERNFRRAAEKCGVSQPTLSAQLRALENRLRVTLVERNRSSVLMTPVGREVAVVSRRILGNVDEIWQLCAGQEDGMGGVIRLGMALTIGPYLLPKMIPNLHRAYRSLKLYVREDRPADLPTALEDGILDLLVVPLSAERKELTVAPLFREPIYLVMSADHPLARKAKIGRRDLKGQSILTLESGHQLHDQVERLCVEVGAHLQLDYEGTSLDTLREMVGMGMGLTFLPGLYVDSVLGQDSSLVHRRISGASFYRSIGMVWRKSSTRSGVFEILAEHARQTVRENFPEFLILNS